MTFEYSEFILLAAHILIFVFEIISSVFHRGKINKICLSCGFPHSENSPCLTLSEWYLQFLKGSDEKNIGLTEADSSSMLYQFKTYYPLIYDTIVKQYNEYVDTHNQGVDNGN